MNTLNVSIENFLPFTLELLSKEEIHGTRLDIHQVGNYFWYGIYTS